MPWDTGAMRKRLEQHSYLMAGSGQAIDSVWTTPEFFSTYSVFPLGVLSRIDFLSRSFEDRLKDTLKISGAQVAPAEIEQVLLSHPQNLVLDVAVAGVPAASSRDDRVPRAWVVLSPAGLALGTSEVTRLLDTWVRERLSRYKWLTGGIAVVQDIPKNPTGKVMRRLLVDEYVREKERGGQSIRAKL